jgi:hypothetical protein
LESHLLFYFYFSDKECRLYFGSLNGGELSFSEGDTVFLVLKKTAYEHTFVMEGVCFNGGDEDTSTLLFNNYKRNLEYY